MVLLTLDDLCRRGIPAEAVFDAIARIDYATVPGLTRRHAGRSAQWAELLKGGAQRLRLLVVEDQIVGYWQFVALDDDAFLLAGSGRLFDDEISALDTRSLALPGKVHIYFLGVSVLPEYRGITGRRLLYAGLGKELLVLAEKGVFVDEFCATAHTLDGAVLCESIGLRFACSHLDHGSVYHLRVTDTLPRVFRAVPGLSSYYQ